MTITEFITARLDETEAHHRRLLDPPTPAIPPYDAPHRHALRDVAAKRAILEWAATPVVRTTPTSPCPWPELAFGGGRVYVGSILGDRIDVTDQYNSWCRENAEPDHPEVLAMLAAIWSDHPDYQPEWAA